MRYIPHTEADCRQMLSAIGVQSVEDLFADIPRSVRVKGNLRLPPALSEADLMRHLKGLAAKNADVDSYASFLGAGAYHHFAPAFVNHLLLRGEFLTAYTPYQPEISQGTLQGIYEYQTLVCQLTGMEVANASMYDGGSGLAEAVLMAQRATGREEVVVARTVHPEYRQVARTYLAPLGIRIREVPYAQGGGTDLKLLRAAVTDQTACVAVQSPNFFGVVEDVAAAAAAAHAKGGLAVVAVAEPVSLGLLAPPGELGADILVAEGQAFGNPISFGGPYLGFFATRERYIRSMPGRLVGQTEDRDGRVGYVLTLSTREQHIRREKATSNICTNEGLCALAATITMSALGKQGVREMALLNLRKAAYAKQRLAKAKGFALRFDGPTFNEFVVRSARRPVRQVLQALARKRILGGVALDRFYPELRDCFLVCVTEQNRREEIDGLVKALGGGR
ncbi:MAG: aminomethyl-transferring glycine dehydrogenase subunit GcvPA [candidate division NC10 bacterium]|nr:aminomethyl-transferring glycine dehydrogenase subunit GcvPA [candidate division NC10 bacterium]